MFRQVCPSDMEQRGAPITAEEIRAESKSVAMWRQETEWGVFDYEDTF